MKVQMSLFGRIRETSPSSEGPGAFGRYHLHELVNSGGMAELWLATDREGATVAVRRLHERLKFDFAAKRRFVRGCEILQKVHDHECVIGYIEHGKINGALFLAMEYLEASNLKLLAARNDEVLSENIAKVLIELALALEHVHDAGFMHCDFKPENVLLSRNGSLRLVDFDLAQPQPDRPRKFSKNPGTPAYMAPEQLQRQAFDHRVDLFAYGVTAYELLTGRKPFQGETAEEILRKQLDRSDYVAPRALNPDIPVVMERAIERCLQLDMDKRYPLASLLAHDVKTALYI